MICKEIHPPYDRAKLSKALDGAAESFYLRNGDAYYKSIDIDVYNGKVINIYHKLVIDDGMTDLSSFCPFTEINI